MENINLAKKKKHRRLDAAYLASNDCWGPETFLGDDAMLRLVGTTRKTIAEKGGQCIDGWRAVSNRESSAYDPLIDESPIYQQSNISTMILDAETDHYTPPIINDAPWCVQPNDIVLRKIAPVRAALASAYQPRHPVDSNGMIVRGIGLIETVWLAFCLNQSAYSDFLVGGRRGVSIARIGLKAVRELRPPTFPKYFTPIARRFIQINDEFTQAGATLYRLRQEVSDAVFESCLYFDLNQWVEDHSNRPFGFFNARDVAERWLLSELQLRQLQNRFLECGWRPVREKAEFFRPKRLNKRQAGIKPVRLKDVGYQLMINGIEETTDQTAPGRIYRKALSSGIVLLSSFGPRPKVAYVHETPGDALYAVDHWQLLGFSSFPGAWALILETFPIHAQLKRLTSGLVQQFIPAERLTEIMAPDLPNQLMAKWHNRLVQHHRKVADLKNRFRKTMDEMMLCYRQAHSSKEK